MLMYVGHSALLEFVSFDRQLFWNSGLAWVDDVSMLVGVNRHWS